MGDGEREKGVCSVSLISLGHSFLVLNGESLFLPKADEIQGSFHSLEAPQGELCLI